MLILSGHHTRVHTLAFAPDGQTLASVAARSRRIRVWDLVRGELEAHAEHSRRVSSLAFAPGRRRVLAFADTVGDVRLWDLDTNRERHLGAVAPTPGQAVELAFSPDGASLAATGVHESARDAAVYWLARSGVAVWSWDPAREGAVLDPLFLSCRSFLTSLAFAPDCRTVAAGSLDRNVYLWEVGREDPRAVLVHGGKVHHLAYDPSGHALAAAAVGGLVKVWDAATGQKQHTLKGQAKFVHALCYAPDGRTLATAAGDGRVRFWDADTGKPLRAFDWGVGPVHSVAFAPDGMRAAAGGACDIIVWDIDDWGTPV